MRKNNENWQNASLDCLYTHFIKLSPCFSSWPWVTLKLNVMT